MKTHTEIVDESPSDIADMIERHEAHAIEAYARQFRRLKRACDKVGIAAPGNNVDEMKRALLESYLRQLES